MKTTEKLAELRTYMAAHNLDAVVIGNSDPHNSEIAPEHWAFRAYMSGFHGSAGTLAITKDKAGLWTDSRYFITANQILPGTGIDLMKIGNPTTPTIAEWIADEVASGGILSIHGDTTGVMFYETLKETLSEVNISIDIEHDLAEKLWHNRPALSAFPYYLADVEYVGESTKDKLIRVRKEMKKARKDAYILGRTDEPGWLYNIRAQDSLPSTAPVAYGLVTEQEAILAIDLDKTSDALVQSLHAEGVTVVAYNTFAQHVSNLPKNSKVYYDKAHTNVEIKQCASHCRLTHHIGIVTKLKGIKNNTEIGHFLECICEDGAALSRFGKWLEESLAAGETITEHSACEKLNEFRDLSENHIHASFNTILGYKGNGAKNHYTPSADNPVKLKPEGTILLDSGGYYKTGTTDITRVIRLGEVEQQVKIDFTLVLKALITSSTVPYPAGTTGAQIDGITRLPMWQEYAEFAHSTGHGIGFGLEVHEGPQGVSARGCYPFEVGMFTTLEPGLYRTEKWGTRLENIVITREAHDTEFCKFLCFETATWGHFDTSLVVAEMLTDKELKWLNNYHATCLMKQKPYLDAETFAWLEEKCAPVTLS